MMCPNHNKVKYNSKYKTNGICIEYILKGKCDLPRCNFKHDIEGKISKKSINIIRENDFKPNDICRNFINFQSCSNKNCKRIHIEICKNCESNNNIIEDELLKLNIQDLPLISFQSLIEMSSFDWRKAINETKRKNITQIEIRLEISQFSLKITNWALKIIDYFNSLKDIHKLYKYLEITVLTELKNWLNFYIITTTPITKENMFLIIKWILLSKIEAELRYITGRSIEKKNNNQTSLSNPNHCHMRYLKHQNYRIDFLNYLICCQLTNDLSYRIIYFIDQNLYPYFKREIRKLSEGSVKI